jgi:hypothetical protein
MTIQLSPTTAKRLAREAKSRGVKPKDIIEEALQAHWSTRLQVRVSVPASRRRTAKSPKPKNSRRTFDARVTKAKRAAGKLIVDNTDWLERRTTSGTKHRKN